MAVQRALLKLQRVVSRPLASLGYLGTKIGMMFYPQGVPDMDVFRFDSLRDIDKFEIATDRANGGQSVCSFGVKQTSDGVRGVFEGILLNDDPLFMSTDGRSGVYALFRTKAHEPLPELGPYSALRFRVMTDGRPYIVMLTTKSSGYDAALSEERSLDGVDTWQCELNVPGGRWLNVSAPFDHFVKVDRGHVTLLQRDSTEPDAEFRGPNPDHLLSLAVVLADGVKGEFRFCIESVVAARFYDPDEHVLELSPGGRMKRRQRIAHAGRDQPQIEEPRRRLGRGSTQH